MSLKDCAEDICMTPDSDWSDSTSELTIILRLTEVMLVLAVPDGQVTNSVVVDAQQRMVDRTPEEARTATQK